MNNKILNFIAAGLMVISLSFAAAPIVNAEGDPDQPIQGGSSGNSVQTTGNDLSAIDVQTIKPRGVKDDLDLPSFIDQMVNLLLYIVGTLAVIMIIFGGFKYVTSGGESSKVGEAKNTILYSVVGLIVALLAFAIIKFVIAQFTE